MTEAPATPAAVFLDACVLYPQLTRAIALGAARAGLYRPAWSGRVLDEWRLAAARDGGLAAERAVAAEAAAMRAAFPHAEVVPDPAVEASLDLPDRADVHVVAGAVAAGAVVILTLNLRDFPARRLAPFGVEARHPDGFFWELLSRAPEAMAPVIRRAFGPLDASGPRAERNALKRAALSRLGKAWEAMA
ncbi:MAG: PIN domain-containing protein [Thermohalobaculum sp.]|nr:PIN domain-containing protein [Thermohalobaculum sp.]